jgi:hypothetical protein
LQAAGQRFEAQHQIVNHRAVLLGQTGKHDGSPNVTQA